MSDQQQNQLWGGRFSESTDAFVQEFTASVAFDRRMYRQDIQGSMAHASMLAEAGVLTGEERDAIHQGLEEIRAEIEAGQFQWSVALEDVHMNIEARLTDKIGITGKKLHTGRSRNDQVATDIRLWLRDEIDLIDGERTPYDGGYFDTVVIIDMLEHVHTDREFVIELARIMKKGGELVVNVPHIKTSSLIRKLRLSLGLTDEKHGHVRPGYTEADIRSLLAPEFSVEKVNTYSGFFVELADVAISWTLERMGAGAVSNKGNVVTGADLKKHQKKFKTFSMIYPFFRFAESLDKYLYFGAGHSLILRASLAKGH